MATKTYTPKGKVVSFDDLSRLNNLLVSIAEKLMASPQSNERDFAAAQCNEAMQFLDTIKGK